MKTLFSFIFALIVLQGYGQYYETLDSVPKKVKKTKAEKEAEAFLAYQSMDSLVTSRRFVLEADYLSNNRGSRIPVTSTLNFLMADSLTGVIQVGSESGIGANGVGGTTARGNILRWKSITDSKKKSFTITYTVFSSIGTYDVVIFISPYGYATGRISGSFGGSLQFEGKVVPLRKSRVYQGSSI